MWIFNWLGYLWGSHGVKISASVVVAALVTTSAVYQFNLAGPRIQYDPPPLLGAFEKLDSPQNWLVAPTVAAGVSGTIESVLLYPIGALDRLHIIPKLHIPVLSRMFGTDNAVDENAQCDGIYFLRPSCLGISNLPFIQTPRWPLSLWADPSECKIRGKWMWQYDNIPDDLTCLNHKLDFYAHHYVKPGYDIACQCLYDICLKAKEIAVAAFDAMMEEYKTRFSDKEVAAMREYSMEKMNLTRHYISTASHRASNFINDQWRTVKHSYRGCMSHLNSYNLTWVLEDPRVLAANYVNSCDFSWFQRDADVIAKDVFWYCANATVDAAWLVFVFPCTLVLEGLKICAQCLFEVCRFLFRVDNFIHWQLTPDCLTPVDILPIVEGVVPDPPCQFYEFECVRAALILYQRLFVPFWMYLAHFIIFAYRYTMIYHYICMCFGNYICYPPLCIFHRYEFDIPDLEIGLFEDDE